MEGETFHDRQPENNKQLYDYVGDVDDLYFVCSGILKCNNPACGETVTMSGTYFVEQYYLEQPVNGYDSDYATYIRPNFFYPFLPLFPLFDYDMPQNIMQATQESFRLFWSDLPSCISKLRVAVERILDDQGIPKENQQGNRYNLHRRIDLFKAQVDGDLGEFLEAVKWLGNEGTHENRADRDDVLTAFDMVEHVFQHLYVPEQNHDQLRKARDRINQRNRKT